eukprot:CAMPEP_0171306318 /NCGR_PEP_ID=MMETSP0816-20121228/16307_1 /TAXON_ID=420281 /ORGANISM="Proboscia inermis, Strain CCAP1064/1" /LENGTH=48 /DNA_ID= /DNA_START= /DNA_END= /DNA_ORIENTATION=
MSLFEIRTLKKTMSPMYETAKDILLTKHPVFREWVRRDRNVGIALQNN